MDSQNPVISARLDDIRFEAVLDNGFIGDYSFSGDIHSHTYYELILAARGGVWIEPANQSPLYLEEGQACLLMPGIYHQVSAADSTSKKLAIRFHYTREGVGSLFPLLEHALQCCKMPVFIGNSQLYPVFLNLQQQLHSVSVTRALFLQNLLQQAFLLLIDQLSARTDPEATPEVSRDPARRLQLEEYLEKNFRNPITEEDLARYMHLSKRQVSRVLRDFYGKSFRKLLVEMRLQEAGRLLRRTDLAVVFAGGKPATGKACPDGAVRGSEGSFHPSGRRYAGAFRVYADLWGHCGLYGIRRCIPAGFDGYHRHHLQRLA